MTPQKASGRWRNDEQRSEGKGPTGLNGRKREKRFVVDGGIAKGVGWPRAERRTGKVEKLGIWLMNQLGGCWLGMYILC